MNEDLIARIVAGVIALMGATMILFNGKLAPHVLHNHRVLKGEPSDSVKLKSIYRLLLVTAGLLFFIIGVLGASGVMTLGR